MVFVDLFSSYTFDVKSIKNKQTFSVRHVIWKLKSHHNRLIQYQTEWV